MRLPPGLTSLRALRGGLVGAVLALLAIQAMAQGHGSAAVANVGPPEAALFPDLAAL